MGKKWGGQQITTRFFFSFIFFFFFIFCGKLKGGGGASKQPVYVCVRTALINYRPVRISTQRANKAKIYRGSFNMCMCG